MASNEAPATGEAAADYFLLFRPDDLVNPVGSFGRLGDAISAAIDGDLIRVLPGVVNPGEAYVSVDLTIEADHPYTAILHLNGSTNPPVLTLLGTADFTVEGTAGDDTVHAGDGSVSFTAGGGNDVFVGGAGDDLVSCGFGDDTVYAGAGDDTIRAEYGANMMYGGSGSDYFVAPTDVYTTYSRRAHNLFDGGPGVDTVSYANNIHWPNQIHLNIETPQPIIGVWRYYDTLISIENLIGTRYSDWLIGSASDNIIHGGNGSDEIYGLAGADQLFGQEGYDLIEGSGGNDTMDGGEGIDTLSYYHAAGGVTVSLAGQGTPQAVGGLAGVDTFTGFETLLGSHYYADHLIGDDGQNGLVGYNGYDRLEGGGGNDNLYGMRGNDTLIGGAGADRLQGGGGYDAFVFLAVDDSAPGLRDSIVDFQSGLDVVNLSAIDADPGQTGDQIGDQTGDQAFTFIGSAGFTGTGGELRFVTNGTDGFILADIDGDTLPELEIRVLGLTAMDAGDFVL